MKKRQVIASGSRAAESRALPKQRCACAQEDFDVDGLGEERRIIVEVPLGGRDSVTNRPEAVREHQGVGEARGRSQTQRSGGRETSVLYAREYIGRDRAITPGRRMASAIEKIKSCSP